MFQIFADTHKIIATNIHENIFDIYGVKLDKEKLLWGSVAPDILPQYKIIRHYKKESLNFVTSEIMKIIFVSRYIDFNNKLDPIAIKLLSKKIGIISHYLSDYVCLAHANRWTFFSSMKKHLRYETRLNEIARTHEFNKNMVDTSDIDIYDSEFITLGVNIKNYIDDVMNEYSAHTDYKNDLDFALSINLKMTYFILDTIEEYSGEIDGQFAFEL